MWELRRSCLLLGRRCEQPPIHLAPSGWLHTGPSYPGLHLKDTCRNKLRKLGYCEASTIESLKNFLNFVSEAIDYRNKLRAMENIMSTITDTRSSIMGLASCLHRCLRALYALYACHLHMIAFHFLNFLSTMVINLLGGHLPFLNHLSVAVTDLLGACLPISSVYVLRWLT